MRKQIGRRLDQVAARRQIERDAGRGRRPEARAAPRRVRPRRHRGAAAPWARNARRACRARAARRRRVRRIRQRSPSTRSICLARQPAGPQQGRRAETGDDGRFDADRAGPPSSTMSMRPRRSASTCAAVVGETWPERLADGATTGPPSREQSARHRMRRHPHRDAVEAGERQIGDPHVRQLRQHQRQRPGPERRGELFGGGSKRPSAAAASTAHGRSAD